MRVSKIDQVKGYVLKSAQLLFLCIEVDHFFRRTLSLGRFKKHALVLDHFFLWRILYIFYPRVHDLSVSPTQEARVRSSMSHIFLSVCASLWLGISVRMKNIFDGW